MTAEIVFLSPHDDDNVLFGAFTCLREKPTVIVCTDSYIQPNRGEVGCSAAERARETERACAVLGVPVERLGLRDDEKDHSQLLQSIIYKLLPMNESVKTVYAPAFQGGNIHHDMVSRAAMLCFTSRVIEYTTYTKDALYTRGTHEVTPTTEELTLKKRALDCHESQLRINRNHFQAVMGKSEWLVKRGDRCLHLGCGQNIIKGWTNMDRMPGADVVCDLTQGIPAGDSSYDYVFSEDFLEHLPPEKKVFMINEIWRVLEPGGIMEHFVPNAGSRNDFGSPTHLSHWNLQTFDHFDVESYRYRKDRLFEGITGGFRKISAECLNWHKEEDGILRAQSIHVKYAAVK